MNEQRIFAGAVGVAIRITIFRKDGTVHDPVDATDKTIFIIDPDNIVREHPASVGTDAKGRPCLQYVTQEGELNRAGNYRAQGFFRDNSGTWPSAPVLFHVDASLF